MTCEHKMGIDHTDAGPACSRSDCATPMCRNCLYCEAVDETEQFCSLACEYEYKVSEAEARTNR